jgi:hypothetical protein
VPTLNQTVSTLRFFFKVTLRRQEIVEHTHFIPHEPRKLPVVLSPEEVVRLLDRRASRAAALDRRHHLQLVEADMAGMG